MTSQFEGAERIADKWGITREDTDRFGLASQQRAIQAWAEGRFDGQYVDGRGTRRRRRGQAHRHHPHRQQGRGPARDDAREAGHAEAGRPRERRAHRRQLVSQISDGAAAVLLMTEEKAAALGLTPRARIVDTCLVGVDPVLMLTGPIDATQRLLARTGLSIDDIDIVRDQRGVRVGRAGVGEGGRRRPGEDQPERRRDRARPPARRHRRVPDDQGAVRARAHRRPLRPRSACAAVAASAPAPSSSASPPRQR